MVHRDFPRVGLRASDQPWALRHNPIGVGGRISAYIGGDPIGDGLVVVVGGPDAAEEVGGVDVAVGGEELAVATAAVHQVGVEFAAEFGAGFGEDAWEVGDAVEFVAEGGDVVAGEKARGGGSFGVNDEIIAADGGYEQCGRGRWCTVLAEVFDEIEELAGFVSDGGEEGEVSVRIIGFEVAVSALIESGAVVEEVEEFFVPGHDVLSVLAIFSKPSSK